MSRTAAALVIGNEVLTGKVQESNIRVLAKVLLELGISLRACRICPDEEGAIIADLNALRHAHDYVFTSGGIGPTHDDITISSIAAGLGRAVVRSEPIAEKLREHHGADTTEMHLRMANIPEGSELLFVGPVAWPIIKVENIFILPGVPRAFRWKIEGLRDYLDEGEQPFLCKRVYTKLGEATLAPIMDELDARFEDVEIGSYVRWDHPAYKVMVTFDGRDEARIDEALSAFVEWLPEGAQVSAETAEAASEA